MPQTRRGPTRAAIARARALYDANEVSLGEIARMLKLSPTTFRKRREEWGWPARAGSEAVEQQATEPAGVTETKPAKPPAKTQRLRGKPITRACKEGGQANQGDAAELSDAKVVETALARAAAAAPTETETRSHRELVSAVRRAVEGELAIVERNQAKNRDKKNEHDKATGDANARTLASLARTLSVLRGLEAEAENADKSQGTDADAPPLDLAELRHELARRLNRLRREGDAA